MKVKNKYCKPDIQILEFSIENDVIQTSCKSVCFSIGPHTTDDENLLGLN